MVWAWIWAWDDGVWTVGGCRGGQNAGALWQAYRLSQATHAKEHELNRSTPGVTPGQQEAGKQAAETGKNKQHKQQSSKKDTSPSSRQQASTRSTRGQHTANAQHAAKAR